MQMETAKIERSVKMRDNNERQNRYYVPLWHKSNLTVEEAEAYSGVGRTKLRQLSNSENCPFVLWNGTKRLIKRKQLDEYLENMYSI